MTWRTGDASQRISESSGNDEDGKHLQEIGDRRWIFKRMSAVGVEESAAVRAQHLDSFLRGYGSLSNRLRLARLFECRGCRIRVQVLRNSLRYEKQGVNDRGRQQYVED